MLGTQPGAYILVIHQGLDQACTTYAPRATEAFNLTRKIPNFVYLLVSFIKSPFECVINTFVLFLALEYVKNIFGPSSVPVIVTFNAFCTDMILQ